MPPSHIVSFFQQLHRFVLDQADDLRSAMDRFMAPSRAGTPTDRDFKTVSRGVRAKDRIALWQEVQLDCLHLAVNVGDHVRALSLLLSQPGVGTPIYAHATAARVAIESATLVAYIHDRNAGFDLRFARGIALMIQDSDEARKAANRVPANPYMAAPGPAATERHEDLLSLIARARVEITLNRNGDRKGVRTTVGGSEAIIGAKMTELSAWPEVLSVTLG